MTIIRKPYIAPELVTLGDVISVTKQTDPRTAFLDFVYTGGNFPPDGGWTDNNLNTP